MCKLHFNKAVKFLSKATNQTSTLYIYYEPIINYVL